MDETFNAYKCRCELAWRHGPLFSRKESVQSVAESSKIQRLAETDFSMHIGIYCTHNFTSLSSSWSFSTFARYYIVGGRLFLYDEHMHTYIMFLSLQFLHIAFTFSKNSLWILLLTDRSIRVSTFPWHLVYRKIGKTFFQAQ